jgi:hypothetical protein
MGNAEYGVSPKLIVHNGKYDMRYAKGAFRES